MSNERSEDNRPERIHRTPRSAVGSAEVERSRISPAPLAGADLRPGHASVQGEVEDTLDDALIAAEEDERAAGAITNEAPALVSAMLSDRRGLGILRLVWGAEGSVIETMGSWRQLDSATDDVDVVEGERSRFVGTLYLNEGNSVPIDTEVIITGAGVYTDIHGETVRLVRFGAPALIGDERFARVDSLVRDPVA